MASLRFRGRGRPRRNPLLLVALGAVTGMALALILTERGGDRGRRRVRPDDVTDHLTDDGTDDEAMVDDLNAFDEDDLLDDELSDEPADELADDGDDALESQEFAAPPDAPADEELERRVLEAFHNDPTLRGRAIDIGAIGDGIIELTGWVHSAAEVGHAITLARGVPGVAHVMDSLTIRAGDQARARRPSADE